MSRDATPESGAEEPKGPRYDRPVISRIVEGVAPWGVDIFISGKEGASDIGLLRQHGITTVVNCAVNLDFNYVTEPTVEASETSLGYGWGEIRYYKLGLIDGPGNPETMMLAGYYLLQGAFAQILPERASYPRRERGNVLVNCRGVSSWQAPAPVGAACEHRIIMGTLDARLIAVDAQTGKPCTDFGDNGSVDLGPGLGEFSPQDYSVTSPPAILDDLVITGAMVLDRTHDHMPSGVVRASSETMCFIQ